MLIFGLIRRSYNLIFIKIIQGDNVPGYCGYNQEISQPLFMFSDNLETDSYTQEMKLVLHKSLYILYKYIVYTPKYLYSDI